MSSSRLVSRLLVPTTVCRRSLIGNANGPIRHLFYRNPRNLPDVFLGSASNLFRDLEREFDRMQRQFDGYFRHDNNTSQNRSPVNYPRDTANGENYSFSFRPSISPRIFRFPSIETDLIVTEPDGSRKFHLAFDMRGFEPEEVKIKTQNGTLMISAKKEKKVTIPSSHFNPHRFLCCI